jgi:hypothetical protein
MEDKIKSTPKEKITIEYNGEIIFQNNKEETYVSTNMKHLEKAFFTMKMNSVYLGGLIDAYRGEYEMDSII